jgi:hypothetical protein
MKLEEVKCCSLCGKPLKEILILTQVVMDMHSYYHREDNTLENMNGLHKQTGEFFCEECFQAFVDKLESFATEQRSADQPTE